MTVSLIIPAYNEEERLPRFLEALATFLAANPNLLQEVLIVDDGSHDRTTEVATRFRDRLPGFRVLRHSQNRGKGAAVQLGVNAARSDAVLFIDADGATAPQELPNIIAHLDHAPIVVGHRWTTGAVAHGQTPLRSISSHMLRLSMTIFGLGDTDTMCGCKAFRRDIAVRLFHPLLSGRWLFDQEVLFRARLLGIPTANIPIHWTSQRGSKLRLSTLVRSALELPVLLLRVWWQLRFNVASPPSKTPSPQQ